MGLIVLPSCGGNTDEIPPVTVGTCNKQLWAGIEEEVLGKDKAGSPCLRWLNQWPWASDRTSLFRVCRREDIKLERTRLRSRKLHWIAAKNACHPFLRLHIGIRCRVTLLETQTTLDNTAASREEIRVEGLGATSRCFLASLSIITNNGAVSGCFGLASTSDCWQGKLY